MIGGYHMIGNFDSKLPPTQMQVVYTTYPPLNFGFYRSSQSKSLKALFQPVPPIEKLRVSPQCDFQFK